MLQAGLLRDHDLALTIKLGLAFYLAMGLLVTSAAICSHQHQIPRTETRYRVPQLYGLAVVPEFCVVMHSAANTAPRNDFKAAASPPQEPASPYDQHIIKASRTYQVEAALIRAVIMAESGYNPNAVSRKGAQGLMQLMPDTAKWLGVHDAFDPALNIDGGVKYLRRLLDRFDGDVQLALAAYNAGSRHVRKYGGVPPFKATHIYIKKVMKYRKRYRKKMAAVQDLQTLGSGVRHEGIDPDCDGQRDCG
jgi:soluble lytic murein transglycosylase-like protein